MLSTPQNSPADGIATRHRDVRRRLEQAAAAAGRDVRSVTLLAVSKGQEPAAIRSAIGLGLTDFGENYVDEALPKIEALGSAAQWHFIGRLQANKTRQVATHFSWVHSVDRIRTAERLASQRSPHLPALNVCVQVRMGTDPSRSGIPPAEALDLLHALHALPRLRPRGLMCMLPYGAPVPEQHAAFAAVRHLLDEGQRRGLELDTLSMGMSNDLAAAIIEGATIVRVGTALFGPRAT